MSASTKASPALKGGCLCGGVRYELTAAPTLAGFCYCESCRKLSGSGHAFHAMVSGPERLAERIRPTLN